MKFELSDKNKAKARAWLRIAAKFVREAYPPTVAWIMTHKATIVILLLVLYIFFMPRRASNTSTVDTAASSSSSQTKSNAPAGTQPAIAPAAADGVTLYDPSGAGADPTWGLPAQLDTETNRQLAAKLKKLESDSQIYFQRDQLLSQEYEALADGRIRQLLFDRVAGKGFKDRNLPLVWQRVSKFNGVNGFAEQFAEGMAKVGAQLALSARLQSAENDVIGGTPTVGDTLFAAQFQKYIDNGSKQLDNEMPVVADFCARVVTEFPELRLTYYDRDGTQHVHEAGVAPQTIATAEDQAAMQKLFTQCRANIEFYDKLTSANRNRLGAIESQRDLVMQVNDTKIKSAWALVIQAKELPMGGSWIDGSDGNTLLNQLPDRLIAGQATDDDYAKLKSFADELKTDLDEAKHQKQVQLKFRELAGTVPELKDSLDTARPGYQPMIWGEGNNP